MPSNDRDTLDNLKILDCTIRDGGYLNNWKFDKKTVREVYKTSSNSGVDIFEIGFRSTEKYFNKKDFGLWKFCDEDEIRDVTNGRNGIEIGLMVDFGKVDITDILESENSIVSIIRVAVHKNKIKDALKFIEKINDKGYETSIQMMGYSTFTKDEQKTIAGYLKNSNVDYAYIADSYGSIFPFQIKELFAPLLEIPNLKLGFHPHNSLQMAFANTIEAIHQGIDIIDGSMYGMGRGAGNLPLEIIVSYLQQRNPEKYNVVPILQCIDKHFLEVKKEMQWGYQLPYMISGIFNSHPYYAKKLIDWREYTIEDVWNVLNNIKKRHTIGFSEDILKEETEKTLTKYAKEKPNYVNRHKNKTFLVLANGPSLKKYRNTIVEFIKKHDPIILGANYLGALYIPHYHCFTNKRRFMDYIQTVNEKSKLLLGSDFEKDFIEMYTDKDYERLVHGYKPDGHFKIENGIIYTGYYTVSTLLIPIASVMGADKIYVAGMDGYKDIVSTSVHFYKEKDEAQDIKIELEKQRKSEKLLDEIQQYLEKNNFKRFHIITPTSYENHYKDIDLFL